MAKREQHSDLSVATMATIALAWSLSTAMWVLLLMASGCHSSHTPAEYQETPTELAALGGAAGHSAPEPELEPETTDAGVQVYHCCEREGLEYHRPECVGLCDELATRIPATNRAGTYVTCAAIEDVGPCEP